MIKFILLIIFCYIVYSWLRKAYNTLLSNPDKDARKVKSDPKKESDVKIDLEDVVDTEFHDIDNEEDSEK
jgi:hypothetical protein